MALTKLTHHNNCEVEAQLIHTGPHYARLFCTDCKVHIQWLTWWDYVKILELQGTAQASNGIKERSVRV